ncbi:ABC transporter substrate-binding protein [Aestuariivirga sp.]|uniref:ABC transporter substrate-binding protein n=1 Tax=Aestuariivirga sp. TaxID=2650926 RepID=UPI0039E561E0
MNERPPSKNIDFASFNRRRFLLGTAATGAALFGNAAAISRAAAEGKYAGQTLNFMIIQPHVVTGRKLAEDFEKLTGAKVNVTPVPYDQIQTKATLDVQSGTNEFDVIDYWYTTLSALVEDGIVTDVTDWIERDKAELQPDDVLASFYDTYTLRDGKRWGFPYDGDSHLLFYNKEILDRNGLKAPTTWEEYLEVTKAVTAAESKNGIYGAAVLGGKAPIIIGSTFANRLAGYGGTFLKEDGTSALDSEAALAAAQSLKDIIPHAMPTPLETRFEEGLPAFLGGKVALIEFWSDLGVYAQDPKGSKIVDKWGVVRNPTGGKNTKNIAAFNAGFGFAITSGSKNKELAWEFVKFGTGPKVQKELVLLTGSGIDPSRKSQLYGPEYRAFAPKLQEALAGQLESGLPWPTNVQSPKLQQILADGLAEILAGQKEPTDAIAGIHAAWNQALSS